MLAVGYVPLTDAAPVLVAAAMGFDRQHGIVLRPRPAPSWSRLRDLLAGGAVDAAHALAPMVVAPALGLGGRTEPLEALAVLSRNGTVLGVPAGTGAAADPLDPGAARARVPDGARVGVPFPLSMQALLAERWLGRCELVTVPPARMAEAMGAGEIDAFHVGEPWGSVAVEAGVAELVLAGRAIWSDAPEKVLAAPAGWAEAEPDRAAALVRALHDAAEWLARPTSRAAACEIVARALDVPSEVIDRGLTGRLTLTPQGAQARVEGLMRLAGPAAGFPWRSQAAWIGDRLARRHGLDRAAARRAAAATFRTDLYRAHMAGRTPLPGASFLAEGGVDPGTAVPSDAGRLVLAGSRFFDGRIFEPL